MRASHLLQFLGVPERLVGVQELVELPELVPKAELAPEPMLAELLSQRRQLLVQESVWALIAQVQHTKAQQKLIV